MASHLINLFSLMFFAVGMAGCGDSSRYEMSSDSQGRTVRLDKETGEIAVIEDDRLTTLKSDKDAEAEQQRALDLQTPLTWNDVVIPQIGNVQAGLSTSWRNGEMFYRFTVRPINEGLSRARQRYEATLTLQLLDANGFALTRIPVTVRSMSRIVNDKGEDVALSRNDSILMPKDTYSSLAAWNVSWNF